MKPAPKIVWRFIGIEYLFLMLEGIAAENNLINLEILCLVFILIFAGITFRELWKARTKPEPKLPMA